ncbi:MULTISPECIES: restriction endonuclease subunit S [Burkholderia]|uniref:restriction endonuclease subunit S n=1 Tax=Burkholderia TaxID=32008 RepID=UPI0013C4F1F7|nr:MULTISPECIES: restriction endonuclease subunit S [Burkholderia]
MTAHKPHAAMKDSGVAWLGKVPAHWDVVQSRRLFSERNQSAFAGETQLTVSQKYGLLPQAEFMELEGRRIVQVQKGHDILKHVDAGDFVISMRSFQGGLEYSTHTGSVSSAYVALTPIKWVEPRFFRHLFKSDTYIQALQSTSDLVRDGQALRFENFSKVALPVVPRKEQVAIADHLDRETARIDKLIARKARFIELLSEKRQALITHAVTKGLNPNAKMKDSGVEWLGKIPAAWQVIPIKRVTSLRPERITDVPSEWTYVGLEDVAAGTGRYEPTAGSSRLVEDSTVAVFSKGNVLYGKLRPYLRKSFVAEFDGACSTEFLVFQPQGILAKWLNHWLLTIEITQQIEASCQGVKMPRADWSVIGALPVVVPDCLEQKKIIEYIERKTSRIDTLVTKTVHSIELLREHRTALITAAVTGKIDLRDNA